MNGFIEPRPDVVSANPGGPDDPLGESVLDVEQPWLRVFAPRDLRLVIGRGQDPTKELIIAQARADDVPIHRRVCGGGAVVLAPGMLVVAIRLRNDGIGVDRWFRLVNEALIAGVAAAGGGTAVERGHGDLAVIGEEGAPRKIVGASLRQTARLVVYLGAVLVDDAVPSMERYLAAPSRQPDYRSGRGHGAFCDHLGRRGVRLPVLSAALDGACRERLGSLALR